ncbi:MAG: hypothetical protein RLZZ387_2260 [Chloroflexota bacterium]|jgi:purine-binding chemotaxis protein CheW
MVGTAIEPLVTAVFQINDQQYALPVAEVREVVRVPALLTIAGAPPVVCGLLNLRGSYLPVIDGRRLVGAPPHISLASQIVIAGIAEDTRADRPVLGLLVDHVLAVRSYAPEQCVPIDQRGAEPFLRAVLRGPDGAALLCDLAELRRLAPAVDYGAIPASGAPRPL